MASKLSNAKPIGSMSEWQLLQLAPAARCEATRLTSKIRLLLVEGNLSFAIRRDGHQNVWARSDLRGKKLKASRYEDLYEPGPGVWPLRPATRHCGGERMAAAPA